MVVEHPHIRLYAYAYECRSLTTPMSTSKVQPRQCSVVRQTLRQLLGSLIADAVSCKPHARALSCVSTLIYECMGVRTFKHTHMRARADTHTHTHTHTSVSFVCCACAETGGL